MEALIIRVLQGNAAPEEEERLQRWRALDPANDRLYREIVEVWEVTGAAAPMRGVPPLPEVDALVAEAKAQADRGPVASPAPLESRRSRRIRTLPVVARLRGGRGAMVAVAAIAVVAAGLGAFAAVLGDGGAASFGEVATGAGESVTVTLDDGTAIRVGPESTLRLERDGADQVAWLEGRAFFGVQRNPSRTFTVRTPTGEATVLGTRFEVRSEDRAFRVLVVDGDVRVRAGGASLELGEGLVGESLEGGPAVARRIPESEDPLAWMGRALLFQATPLGQALSEVRSRYGVSVVLEDSSLADLTVTATFTDRSVEEVTAVICATVGAACEVDEGEVRIGVRTDEAASTSP